MGSIADLLGDQLRAGLAQLVDPDSEAEGHGECPGLVQRGGGEHQRTGARA